MQHTEAAAPHQRYHIPNLKRGLEVFEVLAKNTDGISLSEISRITGYSKNSIFRIICTLEDCGYVVKNKDQRKIRMSRKLAALGYAAFGESNIVERGMDLKRIAFCSNRRPAGTRSNFSAKLECAYASTPPLRARRFSLICQKTNLKGEWRR